MTAGWFEIDLTNYIGPTDAEIAAVLDEGQPEASGRADDGGEPLAVGDRASEVWDALSREPVCPGCKGSIRLRDGERPNGTPVVIHSCDGDGCDPDLRRNTLDLPMNRRGRRLMSLLWAEPVDNPARAKARPRMHPGGSFLLDLPPDPTPVWGDAHDVLHATGEALLIASSPGLGKTTLAQQWTLGRVGVASFRDVLGLPVVPGEGKVLYLAMDRPRQAARSMQRMVDASMRDLLDDRLVFWSGPPPRDLGRHPDALAEMCEEAGADSVVVDSLKDAVLGLTDDEKAAGWNRGMQTALEAGVEVLALHHQRKAPNEVSKGARVPTLDDVYGSAWITAGMGSVVLLSGAAGSGTARLHHVKQPKGIVGPWDLVHDYAAGTTTAVVITAAATQKAPSALDRLREVLAAHPAGATATQAADALGSNRDNVRKRLKAAVADGTVVEQPGGPSGALIYTLAGVEGGG